MAHIRDLSWRHRLFLTTYRFRRLDPLPWTPIHAPLGSLRVGLITTAALYAPGMKPFDEALKGGDTSFRVLPILGPDGRAAPGLEALAVGHRSDAFDERGIEADYNLALPVLPFLALHDRGKIGALHREALSFMGSVTAPGRLIHESAPEAARRFQEAGVDVAFLTPV